MKSELSDQRGSLAFTRAELKSKSVRSILSVAACVGGGVVGCLWKGSLYVCACVHVSCAEEKDAAEEVEQAARTRVDELNEQSRRLLEACVLLALCCFVRWVVAHISFQCEGE